MPGPKWETPVLFGTLTFCAASIVGIFLASEQSPSPSLPLEPDTLSKVTNEESSEMAPLRTQSVRTQTVRTSAIRSQRVEVTLQEAFPESTQLTVHTPEDWKSFYDRITKPTPVRGPFGGGFIAYPNGFHTSYYESGNVKEQGEYYLNRRQGFWIQYFESGLAQSHGEYLDHAKVGPWTYNNADGQIVAQGIYCNGVKKGLWHELQSDGALALVDYDTPRDATLASVSFRFR